LTEASEERDRDLLKDLFFVVQPSDEGGPGGGHGAGETARKTVRRPIPKITRKPSPVKVDRVSGGFKVSANPKVSLAPRLVTVELAYAVRSGNPFKKYVPEDFELGSADFTVDSQTADITTRDRNKLVFRLDGPDSFVKVTGFDERRDLEIRLSHSAEKEL
jgi:hypothetical protein